MSGIGMEQHEHPQFELGEDSTGALCFFWNNPWNGKREMVAYLYWPEHPVEATEAVEHLFEHLVLEYRP